MTLNISDYFALGELIASELRLVLPKFVVSTVRSAEEIEDSFKNQNSIIVSHYLDRVKDIEGNMNNPVTSVAQQWLVLICMATGLHQNTMRGLDLSSQAGTTMGLVFDAIQNKQLNPAFTPLKRVNSDFKTRYISNKMVLPLQFEAVLQYAPS